jgi:hypothetical protein
MRGEYLCCHRIGLFSNYSPWKDRPPLCHLDRSVAQWRDLRFSGPFLGMFFDRGFMGLWPTQGDEKRLSFSNYCPWKHRPPLCHLDRSAAKWRDQRFSGPFLGMFFDRGVMGLRPTQGDEKRLLFSNYSHWKHRPPLCHLDRSVPGFPTSRCWQRTRVRLSVERDACRSPTPRVSTGNPGERSGEICGSAAPSWECFSTERIVCGVIGRKAVFAAESLDCLKTTAEKGYPGPRANDRGHLSRIWSAPASVASFFRRRVAMVSG